MGNGKVLATSHTLVFLAGLAVGKYIDHDELSTYREAHESLGGKWRRRAGNAAIGVIALGTISMVLKVSSKSTPTASV
jgi:hypothetical protein